MLIAALNWNVIIVATIAAIPSVLATIVSWANHKALKMPSGGTIGQSVERTNHLAAVTVAHTTHLINGNAEPPHGRPENEKEETDAPQAGLPDN